MMNDGKAIRVGSLDRKDSRSCHILGLCNDFTTCCRELARPPPEDGNVLPDFFTQRGEEQKEALFDMLPMWEDMSLERLYIHKFYLRVKSWFMSLVSFVLPHCIILYCTVLQFLHVVCCIASHHSGIWVFALSLALVCVLFGSSHHLNHLDIVFLFY